MVDTKAIRKGMTNKKSKQKFSRPEGAGNFDNMDDFNIVDSINTNTGTIQHTPANDKDIVNKAYVDDTHVPAGSEGEIQFNESSQFQADSKFFWDNVNKRLGIGTKNPLELVQIGDNTSGNKFLAFRTNNNSERGILYYLTDGTTIRGFVKWDANEDLLLKGDEIIFTSANVNSTPTLFDFNVNVRTKGLLLDSGVNSFPNTDANLVRIFRTLSEGGAYPFNEAGHLILQSRDTGLIRDILFATGNPSIIRMAVKGNGDVGIGIDIPEDKLHIKDTNPLIFVEATGTFSGFIFKNDGGDTKRTILVANNSGLANFRAVTTRFSNVDATVNHVEITSDGNLIVNDLTSDEKFKVNGNLRFKFDSQKAYYGQNKDASITFAGTSMTIKANEVTATDKIILDSNVDFVGDINLTGTGKGLTYGSLSVVSNATETTITTQNVYVQITDFDTNGVSNNTSPDHTNDHITITKPGDYKIECCITANSVAGAGATFEFEVKKNNGNVRVGAAHGDRTLAGGGSEAGAITICTIATLAVNDTIELWTKNETNTQNIIIEDASMSVSQVGG